MDAGHPALVVCRLVVGATKGVGEGVQIDGLNDARDALQGTREVDELALAFREQAFGFGRVPFRS